MPAVEKVLIIGLDCADPVLVFDQWLDRLPALRALTQAGMFGTLESCMPPITVPAWSCMAASKDPGTLGIYGFRNRADYSYDNLSIATSLAVREPRLWDVLAARGRESIVIGVPGTYPIVRPVRGCMVTCFLTPGLDSAYTWPPELKQEIADVVGEYMIDVKNFRTDDKQRLLRQIHEMTDKRFVLARHLFRTRPWTLGFLVEMGPDRIHHGFWRYMDASHHGHEPGNLLEHAIRDYYEHLDRRIGELLGDIDLKRTAVFVTSDHGAQCMAGGFCFNDWLIREGYMALQSPPAEPTRFECDLVDWSRTRAWGEGGYYGRCFLNVRGREPQGVVPPGDYEALRDELIARLEGLCDDQGAPMGTRAYRPQDLYRRVNGVPPDLIVLFGGLRWRSVGTVGNPDVYTFENDTGPDDANHATHGMYILAGPPVPARGRVDGPTLYDVAPTVLSLLGMIPPGDMCGRNLLDDA